MKMFNRLTALITLFLYCFTGFADQTQTNTLSIGKPNSQNKSIIFQKSGNKPVIRMNGTTGVLQFSNDGTNFKDIGSGGGGFKNFVTNFDIEADTSGYSAFKDAAATTPVDGTGGSPTTITLSKTTTVGEVLSQTGSLKVAKSAANGQGEGFSYDFVIDRNYRQKTQSLQFGFDTSSTNYAAGDLVACMYNKDSGALIPLTGGTVGTNKECVTLPKTSNGLFDTTFNATSDDDYRLIVHVSTVNALTYTAYFDNFVVTPRINPIAVPTTEMRDYGAVTITASISNPTKGPRSVDRVSVGRVADRAFFNIQYHQTGTGSTGSGYYLFNIPSAIGTIDVTKTYSIDGGGDISSSQVGSASIRSGGNYYDCSVAVHNATQVRVFCGDTANSNVGSDLAGLGNGNVRYGLSFDVPITQWAGTANTVNGPAIEYACNTNITDADDLTSFSNNSDGCQFGNYTTTRTKLSRFLYKQQPGDIIIFQTSNSSGASWQSLGESSFTHQRDNRNGTNYGIEADNSPVNGTDVQANFYQYRTAVGATAFGGAGGSWSDIAASNTFKWRWAKLSGAAAVAYAEANPGVSAGLLSQNGVKGSTDGSNAPSGYVGEVITASANGVSCTTSAQTMTSIVLPAGDWDVYATGLLTSVSSGPDYWILGVNNVTNSIAGLTNAIDLGYGVAPSGVSNVGSTVTLGPIQKKTSGTYYLICRGGSVANGNFYGTIRARRVR